MTVPSVYSVPTYTGNGTTTQFPFPYPFFAHSDLQVLLYDTVALAYVTPAPVLDGAGTYDYGVSGVLDPDIAEYIAGATVIFNTAPPSNYRVEIKRFVSKVQLTSLMNNSKFPAKSVEGALDRLMMIVQDFTGFNLSDISQVPKVWFAATVAAARALATVSSVVTEGHVLFIHGTLLAGDGGKRIMRWSGTSIAADDGAEVLKPGDVGGGSPGRWLIWDPEVVDVSRFPGYDPSGATDSTAAFHAARDAVAIGGTVMVPPGTHRANVIHNKAVVWQGAGMESTSVRSWTSAGAAFKNIVNAATWTLQGVWNDMTIGGPVGTFTATAIQHGNDSYTANDIFAGRCDFNRVQFQWTNYNVRKMAGNIGNSYHRCYFSATNFHLHSVSHSSPDMHGGCELFDSLCKLDSAQLAVFYVDSPITSGQIVVEKGCIIENNSGFVWFVKAFAANDWAPGLVMDGCWNESNHTAASVTIDAVVYTPPKFARLVNCSTLSVKNTRLTTIELVASVVIATECHYPDTFSLTKDAASVFIHNELHLNVGAAALNAAGAVRSIIAMEADASASVRAVHVKHPRKISFGYQANILASESFGAITAFSGTAGLNTTDANDGPLFGKCQRLSYTSAQTEHTAAATPASGKYCVATVTARLISGVAPVIRCVRDGSTLGTIGTISNTDWKTFALMTKPVGTESVVALYCDPPASGTTVLEFGGYQLLQFDTRQEAVDFLNAGIFAAKADNVPKGASDGMWGTAAPTTGTWARGDIVWRKDATASGTAGWMCTTAGTPGTWKAMANLAA